jgi:hypothetical protein
VNPTALETNPVTNTNRAIQKRINQLRVHLGSHESLLFNQGFNLPTDFNRFETAKRGYDPKAVEHELNALNSELVRVKEQAAENSETLQRTLAQLAQSEAKLSGTIAQSF